MKRIAILAAAAAFAAPAAFAQTSDTTMEMQEMGNYSGSLQQAINDAMVRCNIDMEDVSSLTLSQATQIELATSSGDAGDVCEAVRSAVQ